jgi:NADPH-dependent 2,4-dienoyl-CoA reductase/sulfur reductase-like enzyme
MLEPRQVLIAGGGPAALEAARLAGERVRITLLAASETFVYRQ